jgi:hypothetical protein
LQTSLTGTGSVKLQQKDTYWNIIFISLRGYSRNIACIEVVECTIIFSTLQLRLFTHLPSNFIPFIETTISYHLLHFYFVYYEKHSKNIILYSSPYANFAPVDIKNANIFFVALLPSSLFLPTLYANFAPAGQKYTSLFSSPYDYQVYSRISVRLLILHAHRSDLTSLDFHRPTIIIIITIALLFLYKLSTLRANKFFVKS